MPVLGAQSLPPLVRAATTFWQPFGVFLYGCDGSFWDLVDPTAGVVVTPDGIRGLSMPTFDRYTTVSPSVAGSRWTGTRTQERTAQVPFLIYSDTSSFEWLQRERAFWSAWRPDAISTLQIQALDGTSRYLDVRFVDDNGQTYGMDPSQQAWTVQALNLVAEQPYWYGDPLSWTFIAPANVNWFSGAGGVFVISPGGTTDSAFVTNDGDVDAYVQVVVTGGFSGATLAWGNGSLVLPALADGTTWTIDTNPATQSATDQTGADVTSQVVWNPAPVPRGSEVELDLSLTAPDSQASVSVTLVPRWFRAW